MSTLDAEAVLVNAALRGDKQLRHVFHGVTEEGDCAIGILHKGIPGHHALDSCASMFQTIKRAYGLSQDRCREVVEANYKGWDFLTIGLTIEGETLTFFVCHKFVSPKSRKTAFQKDFSVT